MTKRYDTAVVGVGTSGWQRYRHALGRRTVGRVAISSLTAQIHDR